MCHITIQEEYAFKCSISDCKGLPDPMLFYFTYFLIYTQPPTPHHLFPSIFCITFPSFYLLLPAHLISHPSVFSTCCLPLSFSQVNPSLFSFIIHLSIIFLVSHLRLCPCPSLLSSISLFCFSFHTLFVSFYAFLFYCPSLCSVSRFTLSLSLPLLFFYRDLSDMQ